MSKFKPSEKHKPHSKKIEKPSIDDLVQEILNGNRQSLARAITIIESTRDDHRSQAEMLLETILPHTGKAMRLGISGVPGVGKSTFIEVFGLSLAETGRHVAVLAVDPSSPKTGGTIMGDKTRMEQLGRHPNAFIRPSPSGGTLGGVARRTREAMLCAEAAGFDVILIETVGVGQSEIAVSALTDIFILLLSPAAGDDLQGIKKGIVEIADLIVVNKADGGLATAAEKARVDYEKALNLLQPIANTWQPRVLKCSAVEELGIEEIWQAILECWRKIQTDGRFSQRRSDQALEWMWSEITDTLVSHLRSNESLNYRLDALENRVRSGSLNPSQAAREALKMLSKQSFENEKILQDL